MKSSVNIKSALIVLICAVSFSLFGCNESSVESSVYPSSQDGCDFLLLAKSQTITRFPETGGKFEISILPGSKITAPIQLSLECESCLGAKLNKTVLTENDLQAEISVCPSKKLIQGRFPIVVKSLYNGTERRLNLTLEIQGWKETNMEPA